MIKTENGIIELGGDDNTIMTDFVALLSAFKSFVNKQFPNDPEKATDVMLAAIAFGFSEPVSTRE